MTAQIIQFPTRAAEKWSDVVLGQEATKLAEIVYRRAHERGRKITMEHARRAVQTAMKIA